MRIFHGFDSLADFGGAVVTLGSFDGVHGGHRKLLDEVITQARKSSGESVVMTFEPHPRIFFGRGEVSLLTSVEEKATLLEQIGVDNLIVIPFDEYFCSLDSREFLSRYVVDAIGAKMLIIGYNHTFGHDRAAFEKIHELGAEYGVEVCQVSQYRSDNDKVSSTTIREAISAGDIPRARRLLSHGYIISGYSQNNTIEITDRYKLLPANGRYSAESDSQAIVVEIADRRISTVEGTLADGMVTIIL